MSDYWHTSGDAEWQIAVNEWATKRYGVDWHDRYTPWDIERGYKMSDMDTDQINDNLKDEYRAYLETLTRFQLSVELIGINTKEELTEMILDKDSTGEASISFEDFRQK